VCLHGKLTTFHSRLQLTWTVQQVFGVPYLASLGISNTQMPLFVASGPIAGLVGPPVIAALSDACQSPWGKRKPFILLGGLGAILSFLVLATAQPLAETFVRSTSAARTTSHVIAGLSINSLNFSIQSLQMGLRASVVDQVAPHQQATANLWISRFSSLGSVFVALVGLGYSPAFFDLSMVVVSVLALLLGLVAWTKIPNTAVSHHRPGFGRDAEKVTISGLVAHFSRVLRKARHLPPVTRRTCRVQLVSWFAWFLVLNYTSA
jgi:solute carrier family 45 protein 1/2/4